MATPYFQGYKGERRGPVQPSIQMRRLGIGGKCRGLVRRDCFRSTPVGPRNFGEVGTTRSGDLDTTSSGSGVRAESPRRWHRRPTHVEPCGADNGECGGPSKITSVSKNATPRAVAGGPPRLSATSLAQLDPSGLRELVVALLHRRGHTVIEVRSGAGYEDLIVSAEPLFGPRKALVRVAYQPLRPGDTEAAAAAVIAHDCIDWLLLVEAHDAGLDESRVLDFEGLAALLEHEPSIARDSSGAATVDGGVYDRIIGSAGELQAKDPSGLAWLAALSRNQIPPELADRGLPANSLFELFGMRAITTCLVLGGKRLGSATPGRPEPDALIWDSRGRLSPDPPSDAATVMAGG